MRRRSVGLLGALLGLVLLATAGAMASTGGARVGTAPIDPAVLNKIRANGETTFWVVMKDKANLSKARGIQDWKERGKFVYDKLTREADASQSGIRSQLKKQGVPFKSFWIVNAIQVTAGDDVLKQLAADPQVAQIVPDMVFHTERPRREQNEARTAAVEWGVSNIKAPQVWSTYGDTGQGIVIASIDTGTQFDHPAIATHYRGYLGPGSYDHNYNWYDPANICGATPCDNVDHGTHTMGTMVGDDGAGNQIGVAPGAKWITAKGCESNSCSTASLVAAGQWMLAPTDLNGNNPRPDLRPNIVSNSWGDGPGSSFYQSVVDSWVAAGIFPAFANGNSGSGCGTAGSPGDYLNSYAVGAYDISNVIASFSSRGPSAFSSETKPNISAPGVNVRSSIPTNSYANFSGTSMATPHLAAAVALIWAAAPSLIGQITQTEQLLDTTAIDVNDTTCGGNAGDNDVYGEGRLDAFAAVTAAPRGPTGTLSGTVTASPGGAPIPGAEIDLTGTATRTTFTDGNGQYNLIVSTGTYSVTAKSFGKSSQTVNNVTISQGQPTTQNFALTAAPSSQLSGVVRDGANQPIVGATVTIQNTPLVPVTTNGSGAYSFASVPNGGYDVQAQAGNCTGSQTQHVNISSNTTLNFSLPAKTDGTYTCSIQAASYVSASNVLALTGDDASTPVSLPSPFTYYGQQYSTVNVSTNGLLDFSAADATWANTSIPSGSTPNLTIYPYWDDLFVDASAAVRTQTLTSPNRFVIEWFNPDYFGDSSRRISFEAILFLDTGQILLQYSGLAADGREQGNSATAGIENATGSVGIQYSFNEAALADGTAILFTPSSTPVITTSTLPDATTGTAYAGATLAATGGTPGYTWALAPSSNPLPASLNLSAGGSISGNVGAGDAPGSYSFTPQVTDSASHTGTKVLTIDVRNPVSITTASPLPSGTVGTAYSQTLAGAGGKTPYAFSLFGGTSLPPGLSLSTGGAITGTPTTAGPYSFTVQLADSASPTPRTITKAFSLTINSGGAAAPSAPQNLAATPAKGKGIQLSWQAPASNGGAAITNYRVYRGGPTCSTGRTLLTALGNVLSYKDTSTTRGQSYCYDVTAVNASGLEGPHTVLAAPVTAK